MHDVAESAGVSLSTVSRVLNSHASVRPETQRLVTEAIEALGFRRNTMASSLRQQRTHATIGLVIQDLANPFYSTIARGVEDVAHEHGHMLVAGSSEYDVLRERGLVGSLLERQVDGLLVVPAGSDHRYLEAEVRRGTPIVFVARPARNLDVDTVLHHSFEPARDVVSSLLARGHRRIGVIGGRTNLQPVAERLAGYREAFQQHDVPIDEGLIMGGNPDADHAEAAARALLAQPEPPDAFFTTSNRMTVGLLRALGTVPAEIAAFDEVEAAAAIAQPITMVITNPLELGKRAAELLFARINGDTSRARTIALPTTTVRLPKIDGAP